MKLTTIWTIPAMSLRERLHRTSELMWIKAAAHLPRKLAYWSFIRLYTLATNDREEVPGVLAMDILKRTPYERGDQPYDRASDFPIGA